MSFRVYVGHSVAPHELGAIYGMAELAARKGMEPIIPDRRWQPAAAPVRVVQLLNNLHAFVAVATLSGQHLAWVNAELAQGLQLGLNAQNVVSVIDAGLAPPPTGQVVVIDRTNFDRTISEAVRILERLQLEQTQRNLLAGLVLGGLIVLLLASKE